MANPNLFQGFLYMPSISTSASMIDLSVNVNEDDIDTSAVGSQTLKDILEKFTRPLILTYKNNDILMHYIVENYGITPSRTSINPLNTQWSKIFMIANYVYNQLYGNNNPATLDAVNDYLNTNAMSSGQIYYGYILSSLTINTIGSNPYLAKMTFQFQYDTGTIYTLEMWILGAVFLSQYAIPDPDIFIYYDPEEDDTPNSIVSTMFNNLGVKYYNNYVTINVPLYDIGGSVTMAFHIFTKGYTIPVNPLSDYYILTAIRAKIIATEPGLNQEQRAAKYPTIFTTDYRNLWPLFTDNGNLANYQVPDPENPSEYIVYNGNPMSFTKFQNLINDVAFIKNYTVPDSGVTVFNTYEVIYSGASGKWFPIIVAGSNGALTDVVPKYTPDLSILGFDAQDMKARNFHQYLDLILNYILGDYILTTEDISNMGISEDESTISFVFEGYRWNIHKRGFTTPAFP